MADRSELSAKAQAALGLPEGLKTYSPFPFGGMNLQSSPIALQDPEFIWMENFIKLGDGNLRAAWDVGSSLYTAPTSRVIVFYSFYTIGSEFYCAIFLDNGSAVQIDTTTLLQTVIGTGFYTSSTQLPYARQWGTQYLLISNRNTPNDYWIWDGTLLYTSGTAAPNGVTITSGGFNYSSLPTVTAFGGLGSGMVVVPTISGGSVVELQITNPGTGYEVGDVVQLAFSGGGSDNSAILQPYLSAGGVDGATITAPGSGYTAATVAFTGGGGTGATGTVTISTGVTSVTITAPGGNYTFAGVTFTGGGGTGAAGTVQLGVGVGSVAITNGGTGYASVPAVSFTGGGGTGAAGTAIVSGGKVTSVTMTNLGSGYTSPPVVVFTGAGANAAGTAVLQNGIVTGVTVTAPGSNYTSAPTVTISGNGTGAAGTAAVTSGVVSAINITAPGTNYTTAPIVTISGNGAGATAVAVLGARGVAGVTVVNGGTGFTTGTAPLVKFIGGGGSGATGVVNLSGGSIASVTITAAGTFYTTAPAAEVSAGENNAAYATVSLMPFGVSGSALETYLSRVWLVNPAASPFSTTPPGGNFLVTAPGSVTDFASSDGGVSSQNTDSFLQTQYVQIRQSSGYLYFLGDGSVSVVQNVSTSGSPATTTFNYQNVDPQTGIQWRDSLQDFGRSTIIANKIGIFGIYGGAVTKISSKLDQLFTNALFPPAAGAVVPTSAIATIFSVKHYLLLLTVIDPGTQVQRNVMITWNEKDWTVTTQSVNFTTIATQKVGSSYVAWGNNGTSIYPLFSQPSSTLTKRLDTKYYGGDKMFVQKNLQRIWMQGSDVSTAQAGIAGTLTMIVSGIGEQNPNFASDTNGTSTSILNQPAFFAPHPYYSLWATSSNGQAFVLMGMRFQSTSPDFILGNWVLGYVDVTAYA